MHFNDVQRPLPSLSLSNKHLDESPDAAEPQQPSAHQASNSAPRVSASDLSARSSTRFKALTDSNTPELAFTGVEQPAAANENSLEPAPTAPEPDVKTRAHTHVGQEVWFDARLNALGALDARQALALRFEAAFAAHTLLLPRVPNTEARDLLVNVLRRYEKRLRAGAGSVDERAGQATVALHGLIDDATLAALEPMMGELEVTLLTIDECISEEQFRAQFTRQHMEPKLLLQYARLLASHGFGIGYQRDRFEHLALELLTTKLRSGRLVLSSRKRAASVILGLTRGLKRPEPSALDHPISYLRDSLDRLQSLTRAKQFFDSGFFVDVCGFKLSKPSFITSPEFLYLCVAIDVEIHNALHGWSQPGKPSESTELGTLQSQLSEQLQLARAAYPAFQLPLGGQAARTPKKSRRAARSWSLPAEAWVRLGGAGLLLAIVVVANLFAFGVLRTDAPVTVLTAERVTQLWPLLLDGRLSANGKHFEGTVARPVWNRMPARERRSAAETFAQALKAQGVDHAEVLAYKTRVVQIDFGSVVFVDDETR